MSEKNKQKSVGIITMHRVLNCGSALQAYALQEVINQMGFNVEIIDYIYPNSYHKSLIKRKPASFLYRLIDTTYTWVNKLFIARLFKPFRNRFLKLSKKKYKDIKSLRSDPPKYDYYIAGSDQIWNPKYVGIDTNFFLGFIESNEKFSYASSLSQKSINASIKKIYSEELKKFKAISVREKLSTDYVTEITGKTVDFVLDPTMLLSKEEWHPVIEMSDYHLAHDYILIYILGYSFEVYDYATQLINHVYEKTGKEVLVFIYSRKERHKLCRHKSVSKVTPANFLYLIKNASLVITDSFHASALSLNFSTPLYPLIKDFKNSDNRVQSLLTSLGAEDWLIAKDTDLSHLPSLEKDYTNIQRNIENLRNQSKDYLRRNLNKE